jgi:hypothetical protein
MNELPTPHDRFFNVCDNVSDLSKIEITKGEERLKAGLVALKYISSDDLSSRLRESFESIKQLAQGRVMGYMRTVLSCDQMPIDAKEKRTCLK